jgi:hypothetical protein
MHCSQPAALRKRVCDSERLYLGIIDEVLRDPVRPTRTCRAPWRLPRCDTRQSEYHRGMHWHAQAGSFTATWTGLGTFNSPDNRRFGLP